MFNEKISPLLGLLLVSSPVQSVEPSSSRTPGFERSSFQAPFAEGASQRSKTRRMRSELAPIPMLRPMGGYVGELQERWEFPSDHLPIGMTFEDLHFGSWNVLDSAYMSWVIEKNSQGLSRSLIADEHIYLGDSQLTIRDLHIIDLILEAINHPTHGRSILSLQECSAPFIEALRARLPSHFEIAAHHGEAVLIDRRHFELVEAKGVSGVFTEAPERTFQDIVVRRVKDQELFRFVNAHLPGDPTKPGRFEFAQYLANTFDPALTTIAMGDMNFDELEMGQAMREAFENSSPFSLYSPYCTNISPYVFNSKAIDHFFVYSPNNSPVQLNAPDEVMRGLAPIAALLEG